MKWILLAAATLLFTDPLRVNKINRHKLLASQAYAAGHYQQAAQHYQYLVDSLGVLEDGVLLNLGHSYFMLGQPDKAAIAYSAAAALADKPLQSVAHQQLGVLANRAGKHQEALQHFKQALMANPQNEDARYNYELLIKKLKDPNQQQQNQQQDKPEQNNPQQEQQHKQEQQNGQSQNQPKDQQKQKPQQNPQQEQQQGNTPAQRDGRQEEAGTAEKKSNIDPQKAREILENMRNREVQYLQQQKRKATKPRDKSKPDW